MSKTLFIILLITYILNITFGIITKYISVKGVSAITILALVVTENNDICTGILVTKTNLLTSYDCLKGANRGTIYVGKEYLTIGYEKNNVTFREVEIVGGSDQVDNRYKIASIQIDEKIELIETIDKREEKKSNQAEEKNEGTECIVAAYRIEVENYKEDYDFIYDTTTAPIKKNQDLDQPLKGKNVNLYIGQIRLNELIRSFGSDACKCNQEVQDIIPNSVANQSFCLRNYEIINDFSPCFAETGSPILCFDLFVGLGVTRVNCGPLVQTTTTEITNSTPEYIANLEETTKEVNIGRIINQSDDKAIGKNDKQIELSRILPPANCSEEGLDVFSFLLQYEDWFERKGIQIVSKRINVENRVKKRSRAPYYSISFYFYSVIIGTALLIHMN